LVEKGGKGHRSDASTEGNLSGLCDPVVNRECPLLVGNYQRKKSRRRVSWRDFQKEFEERYSS
jgi:hypothetical protein